MKTKTKNTDTTSAAPPTFGEIARKKLRKRLSDEREVPAYVIFHDATLAAIAEAAPQSLAQLQGISGLGVKKLEAYGEQVLRVCQGAS